MHFGYDEMGISPRRSEISQEMENRERKQKQTEISTEQTRYCNRDPVKRAGERRHISQYSGELLRERSSERSMPSGRHLVQKYDQSGQIRHSGRSRSSNGGETVAKISHGE